jgi:glyoxylase-like metal-dependent hydrolase (beta-lactamase superfamily II)
VVLTLGVLATGMYWWLFLESGEAEGAFSVDLAEVRRLANVVPGEKPSAIRFEHVAGYEFPSVAVVAGDGWGLTAMPVYAYQLISATHRVMVDTAMDADTSKEGGAVAFHPDAAARVSSAMPSMSSIVVTHEHADHLGGLATHPDVKALMAKVVLTSEQLSEPSRMLPMVFPKAALEGYQAHQTAPLHALAPGVVLIKAPGHTPGAQMVFVQKADGAEVLLIGDVAWHARNIELRRERARLVTFFFLREDRGAVLRQLAWLNGLTTPPSPSWPSSLVTTESASRRW